MDKHFSPDASRDVEPEVCEFCGNEPLFMEVAEGKFGRNCWKKKNADFRKGEAERIREGRKKLKKKRKEEPEKKK